VVLVALLLTSGRPSRAADPRLDAARAHSQEGDSYYKLEKYANAITEYEQAYLAKPDPSFLYNIAQCHRLMGQGAEAIKFYRRFLKDAPAAPNRAVAEKHIRDLEDASPGLHPPAAPPTPAAPPARPVTSSRPPPVAPAPVSVIPPPEPSPAQLPASPTTASPAFNPLVPTSTPVSTTPTVENGTTSTQTESHPIYSRWWFWAGVGAVVVGGIILIAATANHDPSCPGGFTCQGN
jgi:tetratricopeptide (TPR) repeat protein